MAIVLQLEVVGRGLTKSQFKTHAAAQGKIETVSAAQGETLELKAQGVKAEAASPADETFFDG